MAIPMKRGAEVDRAPAGDRKEGALGENTRRIFDPDGNDRKVTEGAGESIDAGLQGLKRVARAARAFGEKNERVAFAERLKGGSERVEVRAAAFDEHGAEDLAGKIGAAKARAPVVGRSDGTDGPGEWAGQRAHQEDGVKMAGVIGAVDALASGQLAMVPMRLGSGKMARGRQRNRLEQRRDHRGLLSNKAAVATA